MPSVCARSRRPLQARYAALAYGNSPSVLVPVCRDAEVSRCSLDESSADSMMDNSTNRQQSGPKQLGIGSAEHRTLQGFEPVESRLNFSVSSLRFDCRLAIRFQSLLRHHNGMKLDQWLDDAKRCGIPAVVNFASALMIEILAVRGFFYARDRRRADGSANIELLSKPQGLRQARGATPRSARDTQNLTGSTMLGGF